MAEILNERYIIKKSENKTNNISKVNTLNQDAINIENKYKKAFKFVKNKKSVSLKMKIDYLLKLANFQNSEGNYVEAEKNYRIAFESKPNYYDCKKAL